MRLDFWGFALYLICAIVIVAAILAKAGPPGEPQCHGTNELRGYHDKHALAVARGIPDPWNYELDHYIPLCLGGADDESNLQFQPWKEAREKDDLEWALCGMVCRGTLTKEEAITIIRKAWPH